MLRNNSNNSGVKVTCSDEVNIKGSQGSFGGGLLSIGSPVRHGIRAYEEDLLFPPLIQRSIWGLAHARGSALLLSAVWPHGFWAIFLCGGRRTRSGADRSDACGGGIFAGLGSPGRAAAVRMGKLAPAIPGLEAVGPCLPSYLLHGGGSAGEDGSHGDGCVDGHHCRGAQLGADLLRQLRVVGPTFQAVGSSFSTVGPASESWKPCIRRCCPSPLP